MIVYINLNCSSKKMILLNNIIIGETFGCIYTHILSLNITGNKTN